MDEYDDEIRRPDVGAEIVRFSTNGRFREVDFGRCDHHGRTAHGWTFEPTGKIIVSSGPYVPPKRPPKCDCAGNVLPEEPPTADQIAMWAELEEQVVRPDWAASLEVDVSDHYVRKRFPKMVVHKGMRFNRKKGPDVCWFEFYDESKVYTQVVKMNKHI